MAWSPLWRGQDILESLLANVDSDTKAAVERDLEVISQQPDAPALQCYEWKGEDHIPWASRVAIVAERFAVRYVAWRTAPYYAIIAIVDLQEGLGS